MAPEAGVALGVVLAGGLSRRMGVDKATLRIAGESLVGRAARKLREVCPEVLVADTGRAILEGSLSVADGPGAGPAAGILGAAAERPGRPLVVLACDLPDAPLDLLRHLSATPAGDWLVPRWEGGLEPLCARYGPRSLGRLRDLVRRGHLAPRSLLDCTDLDIRYLEAEELAAFGSPAVQFRNLNVPGDLAES